MYNGGIMYGMSSECIKKVMGSGRFIIKICEQAMMHEA